MLFLIKKSNFKFILTLFFSLCVFFSCKNSETLKSKTTQETIQETTQETTQETNLKTKSDDLNEVLKNLQESISLCYNCSSDFNLKQIKFLFSVFNKDLSTDNFSSLILNDDVSFSLCNDKRDSGYIDCFYLLELKVKNSINIDEILKSFNKIPHTTIHYKPPNNWSWFKKNNKIYFLHSEFYDLNGEEFKNVDKLIRKK